MKAPIQFALLGATALMVSAGAAKAETADKVVIYQDQLVKAEAARDRNFMQLDVNDDNIVTFAEFDSQALLKNNAETFNRIDANSDGLVTVTEFRTFEKNNSKMRTVTELVGYEETITIVVPTKDTQFMKLDINGDGEVDFKEFQRGAMLDNEYEIFTKIDVDRNKQLSMDEYRAFEKTKGQRITVSDGINRTHADPKRPGDYASATTTRYVPAKTQNFGQRMEY